MPMTTQNGDFKGDTPFFSQPWVWGQDNVQTYRDPNTGSTMVGQQVSPVVTTSSDGGPGTPGAPGTGGVTGPTGATGPTGDKGAILFGRHPGEIVRVVCPEMPETWLMDVVKSGCRVDDLFLSVIEESTLCAIGIGARIVDGIVTTPNESDHVLVGGIRKGFIGRRFVPQTREQMERSKVFWSEQTA